MGSSGPVRRTIGTPSSIATPSSSRSGSAASPPAPDFAASSPPSPFEPSCFSTSRSAGPDWPWSPRAVVWSPVWVASECTERVLSSDDIVRRGGGRAEGRRVGECGPRAARSCCRCCASAGSPGRVGWSSRSEREERAKSGAGDLAEQADGVGRTSAWTRARSESHSFGPTRFQRGSVQIAKTPRKQSGAGLARAMSTRRTRRRWVCVVRLCLSSSFCWTDSRRASSRSASWTKKRRRAGEETRSTSR